MASPGVGHHLISRRICIGRGPVLLVNYVKFMCQQTYKQYLINWTCSNNRQPIQFYVTVIAPKEGSRRAIVSRCFLIQIIEIRFIIQSLKMRKQYDFNEWSQTLKPAAQQTPRTKNKPNIPIDHSRRSMTPSRVQQRMTTSPLKIPLQKAIKKVVKATGRQSSMERNSQSRCLGRSSSRREQSSIISVAKKMFYQEDQQTQQSKAHPETLSFIKKYFDSRYQEIGKDRFVGALMKQYESLWGTQNADKIFEDFTYKIDDIFGGYDCIDLRELIRLTREDGMIGLILRIFKQIKNEENVRNSNYASFSQNPHVASLQRSFEDKIIENDSINGIKNVIQQFMESMYQAMEGEIYAKFNVEMRRMVVKYRETQKLLKKVNDKITNYADIFDAEAKTREKQRVYESKIQELKRENEKLTHELNKERDSLWNEKRDRDRLYEENAKLKDNVEKYQNVFLTRAMENSFIDPGLSRNFSAQSRIADKSQNMLVSQTPQEPFKITIDTHVIHKQNMPPESKTLTTLHNPPTNMPSVSPNKRDSVENGYYPNVCNVSPSHFTTSRVSNYKSVSQVSPYQSKAVKPL